MDDFLEGGGGDLIASLANNATSVYESTQANPLNLALLTGGTAATAQGSTQSLAPSTIGSSGLLLGVLGLGIIFAVVAFAK